MKVLLQEKDIYTGTLVLVNADYMLHRGLPAPQDGRRPAPGAGMKELESAVPEGGEVWLQPCAAFALLRLLEDIHAHRQIAAVSGWRSMEQQEKIWADSLAANGQVFTETYVAVPGHSEHQTGLAVDLAEKHEEIDFICPDFPYHGICQIFRQRAAEYGFVERYPKGKESITGIGHEPWHFRFVGVPHAGIMTELGLTLEEYLLFLRQFAYGHRAYRAAEQNQEFAVSFLEAAENGTACLEPDVQRPYAVSGNNIDGFIITEWKCGHADKKTL